MSEWTDDEFKEYVDWCRDSYFLSELNEENDELNNKYEEVEDGNK